MASQSPLRTMSFVYVKEDDIARFSSTYLSLALLCLLDALRHGAGIFEHGREFRVRRLLEHVAMAVIGLRLSWLGVVRHTIARDGATRRHGTIRWGQARWNGERGTEVSVASGGWAIVLVEML